MVSPSKGYQSAFVCELVQYVDQSINQLLHLNHSVSDHMSPDTIIQGSPKPDYNSLKFEFCTYVQTHDQTTNDMRARTMGAIVLSWTDNADGSYHLMSLQSGRIFTETAQQWIALPMTDIAIGCIELIAKEENQPLVQDNILIEWRPNQLLDPDKQDGDYNPNSNVDDSNDI